MAGCASHGFRETHVSGAMTHFVHRCRSILTHEVARIANRRLVPGAAICNFERVWCGRGTGRFVKWAKLPPQ
jgi:hypothetical protein